MLSVTEPDWACQIEFQKPVEQQRSSSQTQTGDVVAQGWHCKPLGSVGTPRCPKIAMVQRINHFNLGNNMAFLLVPPSGQHSHSLPH